MKNAVLFVPLAFVLGGLVGYVGPFEELRELKARPSDAPRETRAPRTDGFGAFAEMVRIPPVATRRPRRAAAPRPQEPAETPEAVARTTSVEEPRVAPKRKPPRGFESDADLRARIEEASDLWRTRTELVRTSAVSRLGLDAVGATALDAAVATMNERLHDSISTLAEQLAEADEMTPELGVRLMGDLSATLAETYETIGANVGDDRRAEVSKLQLIEFVDPAVAEPLIGVQDKLEGAFRPGAAR